MSQRTTQLKFHFPEFQKVENLIQEKVGEQYKIKAFHYADMIEIKEDRFKHTLHFNKSKDSKIVTKRRRTHPIEIIPSTLIVGVYTIGMLESNLSVYLEILPTVLLVPSLILLPLIIEKILPFFKEEIEEKHEEVRDLILSINN